MALQNDFSQSQMELQCITRSISFCQNHVWEAHSFWYSQNHFWEQTSFWSPQLFQQACQIRFSLKSHSPVLHNILIGQTTLLPFLLATLENHCIMPNHDPIVSLVCLLLPPKSISSGKFMLVKPRDLGTAKIILGSQHPWALKRVSTCQLSFTL